MPHLLYYIPKALDREMNCIIRSQKGRNANRSRPPRCRSCQTLAELPPVMLVSGELRHYLIRVAPGVLEV
ncbi:hypothetical protein TcWFU_004937 [Taenia crassiceps]|uniref:Uncharacterized protein n=1 Tax=Taenia crassiceps TaxID=6207 RepID=A0ABR4Q8U1_9CEST